MRKCMDEIFEDFINLFRFMDSRWKDFDLISVNFSGGRDSVLALLFGLWLSNRLDVPIYAIFVDSGFDIPTVKEHVIKVADILEVELFLLRPSIDVYEYFIGNRKWPNPVYRECRDMLIHATIDGFIEMELCNDGLVRVLNITGGIATQKTNIKRVRNGCLRKIGDNYHLLAPFLCLTKTRLGFFYSKLLGTSLYWRGYHRGFQRTACWWCPFQNHRQWDALLVNYPDKWEKMYELSRRLDFVKLKGDGNYPRFSGYWGITKGISMKELKAIRFQEILGKNRNFFTRKLENSV